MKIIKHIDSPVSVGNRDRNLRSCLTPGKNSVGMVVAKLSSSPGTQPKTFKNGSKALVVRGLTVNPNTGKDALFFEDMPDDYCVDTNRCYILTKDMCQELE